MSFDLFLHHFKAGDSAPSDRESVAAVLARQQHQGPDDFGFYNVEFDEGISVEFNASGLAVKEKFDGCAFHIRSTGPELFNFLHEVAEAGDFVIFNPQGDDSEISPVLILVSPAQAAELPASLLEQYNNHPVCESGAALQRLLFPDFKEWQAFRDKVVGG